MHTEARIHFALRRLLTQPCILTKNRKRDRTHALTGYSCTQVTADCKEVLVPYEKKVLVYKERPGITHMVVIFSVVALILTAVLFRVFK